MASHVVLFFTPLSLFSLDGSENGEWRRTHRQADGSTYPVRIAKTLFMWSKLSVGTLTDNLLDICFRMVWWRRNIQTFFFCASFRSSCLGQFNNFLTIRMRVKNCRSFTHLSFPVIESYEKIQPCSCLGMGQRTCSEMGDKPGRLPWKVRLCRVGWHNFASRELAKLLESQLR